MWPLFCLCMKEVAAVPSGFISNKMWTFEIILDVQNQLAQTVNFNLLIMKCQNEKSQGQHIL